MRTLWDSRATNVSREKMRVADSAEVHSDAEREPHRGNRLLSTWHMVGAPRSRTKVSSEPHQTQSLPKKKEVGRL